MPLLRALTGCDAAGSRESGQGTVEFAVVTAAFLAIVVAFGVLWRTLSGAVFVEHALAVASHRVVVAPAVWGDVLRY